LRGFNSVENECQLASTVNLWLTATGNEVFKKKYFGADKLMVDALRLIHHLYL
jgi:hypothetical protein